MSEITGRNSRDVVMELVHLHVDISTKEGNSVSTAELEDVFLKYYDLYKNRDRKSLESKK